MSDDEEEFGEDWDAEMGIKDRFESLRLPPNESDLTLKTVLSSINPTKDEDWTKDFADDEVELENNGNDNSKPLKITGIKADPKGEAEIYDDAFTVDKGSIDVTPKKLKIPFQRVASSMIMPKYLRIVSQLNDLLSKFPSRKSAKEEIWDDELFESTDEQQFVDSGNDLEKELEIKTKELSRVKEKLDVVSEIKCYLNLGILYLKHKDYAKASNNFNISQELFKKKEIKDPKVESEILYNQGLIALNIGEMKKATDLFKKALDSTNLIKDNVGLRSKIHFQLGMCDANSENWEKALEYFAEGLKELFSNLSEKVDWQFLGQYCLNIGKTFQQLGFVDSAQEYFQKALEASNEVNDNETSSISVSLLSSIRGIKRSETPIDELTSSGVDEFEDWDKELGLEDDRTPLTLTGIVGPSSVSLQPIVSKQQHIANRYKVLDLLQSDVEIMKYPKATFLSTIKTYQGTRLLPEEELESWITQVVSKHKGHSLYEKIQTENIQESINTFFTKHFPKGSIEWFDFHVEYCMKVYLLNKKEPNPWTTLYNFFIDLSDHNVKILEDEKPIILNKILFLLYVACKLWQLSEDQDFKKILSYVKKFDPRCTDIVRIMEAETYIHHNYSELRPYIDTLCEIFAERSSSKTPMNNDGDNLRKSSLEWDQSLVPLDDAEIKVRILTSLQFIATDISPLTGAHIQNADEDEDEPKHSRADSLLQEGPKRPQNLMEASTRMALLNDLYPQIRPSWTKARAAYALGLNAILALDDFKTAEQLFFECLYILDGIRSPSSSLPPILSQLGTNALLRYGEVLLTNFKYPYAIGSFNSAVIATEIRKRPNYFSLLRRTAQYCKDNDDHQRAVIFFQSILKIYETEKKDNEIRLVLDVLSGLYLEGGEFRKAEKVLRRAIGENLEERIDPMNFKLYMKLVDLYLNGYKIEKGIQLLDALNNSILPPGPNSRSLVLTKLAKAYTKMHWFDNSAEILNGFEYELVHGTNQPSTGPKISLAPITSPIPSNIPITGSIRQKQGVDQQKALQYWDLSALNYYQGGYYAEAVFCIDSAIYLCPSTNMSSLAHYYFRRGKIFQALTLTSNSIQFPTTLSVEKPNWRREHSKTFTCAGDFLQECVASYNKAYGYFKVIGDDIHIAKTVNNIATTLLEYIFPSVALLNMSYESASKLPFHDPSDIVKYGPRYFRQNPNQNGNTATVHKRKESEIASTGHKRGESLDTLHKRNDSQEKPVDLPAEYIISLSSIENPAVCGLDICAETYNLIHLTQSHLNMAELRYLQNQREAAIAFWTEARDQVLALFMDDENLLAKSAPPSFLKKLLGFFKRLIRFMFCLEKDFINDNIVLIEAYLLLQIYLDHSLNRPMNSYMRNQTSLEPPIRPGKNPSLGKHTKKNFGSTGPNSGFGSGSAQASNNAPRKPPANRIFLDQNIEEEKKTDSSNNSQGQNEKIEQIYDDCSETIWGYLYSIKSQIQKYAKGKLPQEELLNRNRKTFMKIFTIKRSLEVVKSQGENIEPKNWKKSFRLEKLNFEKSNNFTFPELLKENPQLSKLIYILQIDQFILYYVPSSGKRKIHVIGGKEDTQNQFNSMLNTTVVYLSLHLLANSDECVTLEISPLLTFERLLNYLCNKPYWEEAKQRKKSNIFGTFNRTPLTNLKSKPKFVEQTQSFIEELEKLKTNLISLLPKDSTPLKNRVLSPHELALISFAKKSTSTIDQNALPFTPLNISLATTIAQTFNPQEIKESSPSNPLRLFLYLSNSNASSNSSSPQSYSTIYLTEEMLNYFKTLLQLPKDATDNSEKILTEISENIFSSIVDIIPFSSEENRVKVMPKSGPEFTLSPLILVCSKPLNIFPWELMLGECTVRNYSIQAIMRSFRKRTLIMDIPLPQFFTFYNSAGDRGVIPLEETRRYEYLMKTMETSLHLKTQEVSTIRQVGDITPFHSPLLKHGRKIKDLKRKYKRITWVDNLHVSGLRKLIDRQQSVVGYPVFLMTYTDLMEAPIVLLDIIRSCPDCSFLFVPNSKMKEIAVKLHKIQEDVFKPQKPKNPHPTTVEGRYHFLMKSIVDLEAEIMSPIVVFNPPNDNI